MRTRVAASRALARPQRLGSCRSLSPRGMSPGREIPNRPLRKSGSGFSGRPVCTCPTIGENVVSEQNDQPSHTEPQMALELLPLPYDYYPPRARAPRGNCGDKTLREVTMMKRAISLFRLFPSLVFVGGALVLTVPVAASAAAFTAYLSAPNHSFEARR